ncbi:MAG: CrcB family protein [Mobiluncus sp.]|uniref:fluoride efflux transporter FluC n=1 Tax=Mobiluncus sp. TaxID=47293 RepID=UPI002584549F|nr:CrcB family protein [Mobiluncus sp.]MCI6584565.1 CrcB family protein [Mobiluncus sp.]
MIPLLVALFGGLGAVSRFGIDKLATLLLNQLRSRRSRLHPSETESGKRLWGGWGIIFVNLTGCFLVGWAATSPALGASFLSVPFQTGFLGGYTTFSTAIMDTIGYTWKPRFAWGYAMKSTLLVGVSLFASIGSALAGASLNTSLFLIP